MTAQSGSFRVGWLITKMRPFLQELSGVCPVVVNGNSL